jgi:hypothetical protein
MPRLCSMLCRLSLAAWFGAGVLFLMIVLGLRNSDLFSDEARFNHPRVLFPLYYQLELPLLVVGMIAGWMGIRSAGKTRDRHSWIGVACLATMALALATFDFAAVYRPLSAMLESQVLTMQFTPLHHASRWLNAAVLLLTGLAAGWAAWLDVPRAGLRDEALPSNGGSISNSSGSS